MKLNFKVLLMIPAFLFLMSCDNSSEKLIPNLPNDKVNDKLKNVGEPKIDILFVIDNSGSMGTHQSNLITNIELFVRELNNIGNLDYRIGVTTSTYYESDRVQTSEGQNGKLIGTPNYVDRNTASGNDILKQRLRVGTRSGTNEYFFLPIINAFSTELMNSTNAGFLRDDAYLAIVFITDAEDEVSPQTAIETFNFLVNLKMGLKRRVLSYGAIIPKGSTTDCDKDDAWPPTRLQEFIAYTGGSFFDLCDPQYGAQLVGVAKNLAARVAGEIFLTRRPKVSTITVTYGTQSIPNDPVKGWLYSYRTNSIIFGEELELMPEPPGTEMKVDFEPVSHTD